MNSTPFNPASTILLTAFVPPPPAPTTLITARYEDSTSCSPLPFGFRPRLKGDLSVFRSLEPESTGDGTRCGPSCQLARRNPARNHADEEPSTPPGAFVLQMRPSSHGRDFALRLATRPLAAAEPARRRTGRR